MIFRFLVAMYTNHEIDYKSVISDALSKALEDNLNEFDNVAVQQMWESTNHRVGEKKSNGDGLEIQHMLIGFSLDLPEETEQPQLVIEDFISNLQDTSPIFHVLKFDDPLLQNYLSAKAEEIFALEMKLRKILSIIYLHAYQDSDPFNLLFEESVQLMAKERPHAEHMKAVAENQFYHLTFSQYVLLNRRPEHKLPDLLTLLRNSSNYEDIKEELLRAPVSHEDDSVLLAGLRDRMEAIEAMRNCVAHNRKHSKRVMDNYENAHPELDSMLESYLSRMVNL